MRHSVFVIGSRGELAGLAAVLGGCEDAGLRCDIWLTGQSGEAMSDFGEGARMPRRGPGAAAAGRAWWLRTLAGCYSHVSSLRTWTRSAPLVVVRGVTASSLAGAVAGRFGGGWVVLIDAGVISGKWFEGLVCRLANFALCPDESAYLRMRRYYCKAVNLAEEKDAGPVADVLEPAARRIVARLAGWSG